MKRFHVHIAVADLDASIRFYSALFGTEPTVRMDDYAKWMLEDPRVNFAISKRSEAVGLNHLGFQVESATELSQMQGQLAQAAQPYVEESQAACCYAKSDKYWIADPQGIAWETFHTLQSVPVFSAEPPSGSKSATCCVPVSILTSPSSAARGRAAPPPESDSTERCCV